MEMIYQKAFAEVIIILLISFFTGCNTVALLTSNTGSQDSKTSNQEVQLFPQETISWCWAASGEMVMKFLGASIVSQCDEANKEFSRSDCCKKPVPVGCVNGSFPQFDKYNFIYSRTYSAPLSWTEIKNQILTLRKPVAFSWKYIGSGGHMMVITGFNTIDNINWLYINDPLEVNIGSQYSITYEEYVSGPSHTHWDDFYNITKKS